jgi:hypothetical protein
MRFRWFPFVFLFLALHMFAYAQAPIAFERYYDFGIGNAEEGTCVQQTNEGGYIITGRQTVNLQTMYILLQKTDSLGNVQWMKQIGSQYMNFAWAVKQTADGGYVLTGFTDDASGTSFICLVKTDSVGDTLWSRNYAPTAVYNYRQGVDVILTPDCGFLVLAAYVDQSDTMWQSMLIKTNSIGIVQWTKTYPRYQGNSPGGITSTSDGGYIIATYTNPSTNDNSFYLIKIDSIGDTLWTKTIWHPNNIQYVIRPNNCIHQTLDGGYCLIGTLGTSSGDANIIMVKTNSVGDTTWTKIFGVGLETGGGGFQTGDGGYIIGGTTRNYGNGGSDVWLVKTDNLGNIIWTRTFGGSLDDDADYIIQTSDGGFAISGMTMNWGDGGSLYFVKTDSLGNAPTGIFPVSASENQTSIYPNPFSDFTNIRLSDETKFPCSLILYDFSGREVRNDQINSSSFILDRNDLASGIYCCAISDSEGKIVCNKKIIVQ